MEQQVVEFLDTYTDYLTKLSAAAMTISEKLRADEAGEALAIIKDFSEGLSWVAEGYTVLQQYDIALNFDVDSLDSHLNEINDGLQIRDYVLVADIFEYEITPFVDAYLNEVHAQK